MNDWLMLKRLVPKYPLCTKLFLFIALFPGLAALPLAGQAQVAAGYEVATWYGFKTSAVTYTFDDNTVKQLSVAIPLFDQYNFKITLFPVINWSPNWAGLKNASNNGHEVASHTVSHPHLNTLSVETQETELKQSKAAINSNITNSKCVTIAYPYCETGNLATLQKYYIAGRICSGVIEPKTPADFFRISSIAAGSESSVKTAQDFNNKVSSAKTAKGWCVFMLHGIDNDGGYSPVQSAELSSHLAYVNSNSSDYWVATFGNVAKYIRERNAVSLIETTVTADSLLLVVADNLPDSVYNVPLTVRRKLPSGWLNARVFSGGNVLTSAITTSGTEKFIVFDVVPDQGVVSVSKSDGQANLTPEMKESPAVKICPNPFSGEIKIQSCGECLYFVYSSEGKLVGEGRGTDTFSMGKELPSGTYLLQINQEGQSFGYHIVKNN